MQIAETKRGVAGSLNLRLQRNIPIAGFSKILRTRAFFDQTPQSLDKIA